jgi:hypothetical protein
MGVKTEYIVTEHEQLVFRAVIQHFTANKKDTCGKKKLKKGDKKNG